MIDLRCYAITAGHDRAVVDLMATSARAGAGVVQVRAKDLTTRQLLDFTRRVAEAVQAAHPPTRVLVDDSVEVAYAARRAGAHVHGVHLGAEDLPVRDARALLGKDAIIGLTTGNVELVEASREMADAIDYIGAGPFRPTPTKNSDREPLGVAGYPPLVALSDVPVVAIGDVQVADVPELAATGVAGVALVRALHTSADPAADVQCVLQALT